MFRYMNLSCKSEDPSWREALGGGFDSASPETPNSCSRYNFIPLDLLESIVSRTEYLGQLHANSLSLDRIPACRIKRHIKINLLTEDEALKIASEIPRRSPEQGVFNSHEIKKGPAFLP